MASATETARSRTMSRAAVRLVS